MIVPSVDLMAGRAVQLVGGRGEPVETADPFETAERFAVVGELAVIDLDAALGRGSNAGVMSELIRRHPCRVGGGIRSVDAALQWLDAGAERVILGTAAIPEVLAELPRERVIAALDGVDGEVVVRGWTERTGATVLDRLAELGELVGGFLVTFVEREGRLGGIDLEACRRVVEAAGGTRVTAAGGITTAAEVAALDRLGADAQVGMALYTGRLGLAEAFAAPLDSDRLDGLWPTVVADEHGVALGLVYSNDASLAAAVAERRGVYWSRSRGGLWRKGETSGAVQELLRVEADCDRDALRFTVRQAGSGFCHRSTRTCWGADAGLPALERRLHDRLANPVPGSYTERLARDPALLAAKLAEEAAELAAAATPAEVAWEAADVLYFTLATLAARGVPLEAVAGELDRRSRAVRRRDGSPVVEPGGTP
ncbi:MAG TPA: phosphoribosyl-ATP diphosphatase [Candidatus Sulfomarinibacteraceae bacterium]|nr:phosphoribosyl-ATP diphosphatase [Candidatus Sulfomarinibacteraceae bacterium]